MNDLSFNCNNSELLVLLAFYANSLKAADPGTEFRALEPRFNRLKSIVETIEKRANEQKHSTSPSSI